MITAQQLLDFDLGSKRMGKQIEEYSTVHGDSPIIPNMSQESTGSAHLANIINSTTDTDMKELLPWDSPQAGGSGTVHEISGNVKEEDATPPPLTPVCNNPFCELLGITISITAVKKTSQETISLCFLRCNTT